MRLFARAAAVLLGAVLLTMPFAAAQAAILITIDKATQQMTVDVNGSTRWVWPVSTGRRGYDTPAGSFRAFRMEEEHYSKEWDDAPMPHSIFFTSVGHAIHGSYETRNLGRPASHGCVRISPQNATKLFALVKQEGVTNAKVVVLPDRSEPVVAKSRNPAQQAGYATRGTTAGIAPAAPQDGFYPPAVQSFGYAPSRPAFASPIERPTVARPGAPIMLTPPFAPSMY